MNKKCIRIIFIFFVFVYFFTFISTSFAAYGGDDTYTDSNNTILSAYDSICNDFVTRMQYSNSDLKSTIYSQLASSNYMVYLYYGSSDGLQMIGSSPYNTRLLYAYVYYTNSAQVALSQYNDYQGISTNVFEVSTGGNLYAFVGNNISSATLGTVYIPAPLFNYRSEAVKNYFTNSQTSQTNSIVSAIESASQDTQNTIQHSAQETQSTMTNSTVEDSSMTVDTSSFGVSDSEGVGNFLLNLTSTVYDFFSSIDSSVTVIQIPIPFTEGNISLRSDILSSHISGTQLETLIDLVWWFFFGTYYVMFIQRIVEWFSSGKFVEEGPFSFAEWLDIHNEVIKSYMM